MRTSSALSAVRHRVLRYPWRVFDFLTNNNNNNKKKNRTASRFRDSVYQIKRKCNIFLRPFEQRCLHRGRSGAAIIAAAYGPTLSFLKPLPAQTPLPTTASADRVSNSRERLRGTGSGKGVRVLELLPLPPFAFGCVCRPR